MNEKHSPLAKQLGRFKQVVETAKETITSLDVETAQILEETEKYKLEIDDLKNKFSGNLLLETIVAKNKKLSYWSKKMYRE